MKKYAIIFLTISCFQTAFSNIRYVKPASSGSGDGSSWSNASSGLQLIINSSSAGDQIWVAAGTYKPSNYPRNCPSCSGNRDYSFHLQGGVRMYGGFSGTETLLSQRNIDKNPTILSGDLGLPEPADDNVYHVVVYTSDISGTELDGFQISNGGTKTYFYTPSLQIDSKLVQYINGGGAFIYGSFLNISNTKISQNSGYSGAGINVTSSNLININNCKIANNTSINGFGGGTSYILSKGIVSNSTFTNNSSSSGGGIAVFADVLSSSTQYPEFINCVISQNTVSSRGGGIFYYGGQSNTSVTNCTIFGNSAESYGGVFLQNGASAIFKNNIVWGNTSTNLGTGGIEFENPVPASLVSFSIVQGGYTPCTSCPNTNGNINPLFANPNLPLGFDSIGGTFDDGLNLKYTSPAINTGDNSVSSIIDILGRTKTGIKDIGAYEFMPKGNCIDNRHVGDNPIEAGTHFSSHFFTADGTVGAGTSVIFNAGNDILLLPGFKTQPNAVFKASILGCL
ncbi:right-handed parallel beta-helix repeat-containing protein [Lacihabitans sp. LS3-19]|uniref:right-handed parallel beta-helix repeat-containing protein n=1 Tax=Lacihabitans sp. LS3-19 TaxID=2487335 RepID=UPI0020CC5649|nr:right-handed parallel beta-helix repeat-containing protein [Lacihabitans sp. LS3-19]MCP9770360.1 right-handed parallel beta-helix repeat-containing protein [Lacihabitans sp. LS3-19]